jgi:hypothetical protein
MPRNLTDKQQEEHTISEEQIIRVKLDLDILNRIITSDETWCSSQQKLQLSTGNHQLLPGSKYCMWKGQRAK